MSSILDKMHKEEFSNCIDDANRLYENLYAENERLRAENEQLKSEHYKDDELARMKDELAQANNRANHQAWKDALHGFPISEDEHAAISNWITEHEAKHASADGSPRNIGAIGGAYTYEFIPTSIGVLGQVECGSCSEKFVFRELL